ncbi:MAG: radical SAM protein, partial [Bacteroidota bacterium]
LKAIYKDFNAAGPGLAERLRTFRANGVHVLGSFIFGLPTDRPETFDATLALATQSDLTFAQFVTLTPFPGTVDFARWEASLEGSAPQVQGIPVTRHWLIPEAQRPSMLINGHPTMSADEIRRRTQTVWDRFYSTREVWKRAQCVRSIRARLAFVLISKLYRQMYANTGISTDSARIARSARWARWIARPCRRLFAARPMPDLTVPAPRTSS